MYSEMAISTSAKGIRVVPKKKYFTLLVFLLRKSKKVNINSNTEATPKINAAALTSFK